MKSVIFRTGETFRDPYIDRRVVSGCVANMVSGGTNTMTRNTFEYFDYEPSDHGVDARAVASSLVVLLIVLLSIISVG